MFRTWWHDLPADVEVCPVQPPGREQRLAESPFSQLEPYMQALVQVLLPYLNLPFAFFGHSLGALLSFECARYLRRQYGLGPLHVFVSACRAPQRPPEDLPIHQLPDPAFVEELRYLNGTPEMVLHHAELMALLLPVLRADFSVYETYVYTAEAPLDCPISAFGGLEDHKVSQDDLAAWYEQTRGPFTLRMFPGDHFFLHASQTPLVRALVQALR